MILVILLIIVIFDLKYTTSPFSASDDRKTTASSIITITSTTSTSRGDDKRIRELWCYCKDEGEIECYSGEGEAGEYDGRCASVEMTDLGDIRVGSDDGNSRLVTEDEASKLSQMVGFGGLTIDMLDSQVRLYEC